MRRLALFVAGFGAATLTAVFLLHDTAQLVAGALFIAACVALAVLSVPVTERTRRRAVLCCAGAAAGLLWTWSYTRLFLLPAYRLDGETVRMSGVVLDWPSPVERGVYVPVRLIEPSAHRPVVRLYLYGDDIDLRAGDRIETIARCRRADRTAAGERTNYFAAHGIALTATAYGKLTAERPDRIPAACWPAALAHGLKDSIAGIFSPSVAPVVTAMTTGDKSGLTDAFLSALRRAGLSHTVAVSGLHLTFLVAVLELLFGRHRRRTALICVPVTVLFALVMGGTASVVRATVMIDLLLIAPLFDRERDGLTSLAFSLLILLADDPYAVADAGLQLSFAAVLGLLLFTGRFERRLLAACGLDGEWDGRLRRVLQKAARYVFGMMAATFGALIFTVPLSAVYFGSVSLIAPLANLAALWLVELVFCVGIVAGAVRMLLPAVAVWIALPAEGAARLLAYIVQALARIPYAAVSTGSGYCVAWLVLLYAVLAAAMLLPGKKRLLPTAGVLCLTLVTAILLQALSLRGGRLTVQALDVGQGQCVLIRAGNTFALIDCGGDGFPNAGDAAADALEQLGANELDLLLLSHYHADHANGVLTLLDRVNIKCIALPDIEADSPLRAAILDKTERSGAAVRFVREETVFPLDGGAVLNVLPPFGDGEDDSNELGLTAIFTCGDFDVLMTGDMGRSVEKLLLSSVDLPDTEVMIAGHHGSKYSNSEELLSAARPDAVIFSAGKGNSYGHPTPEAMARFEAIGAKIYRTDLMGTVTVRK